MLIGFGSWGTVVNWNVNSGAKNYVIQSGALKYYNGMVTLKPHFPENFDVDTTNNFFISMKMALISIQETPWVSTRHLRIYLKDVLQ